MNKSRDSVATITVPQMKAFNFMTLGVVSYNAQQFFLVK